MRINSVLLKSNCNSVFKSITNLNFIGICCLSKKTKKMKKTAMLFLIITAGLVSCAQDDDLYAVSSNVETPMQNIVYAKGGEEPQDSVATPPVAENPDGDPPPKDNGVGIHKQNSNDSIKINTDEKYSAAVNSGKGFLKQPKEKRKRMRTVYDGTVLREKAEKKNLF